MESPGPNSRHPSQLLRLFVLLAVVSGVVSIAIPIIRKHAHPQPPAASTAPSRTPGFPAAYTNPRAVPTIPPDLHFIPQDTPPAVKPVASPKPTLTPNPLHNELGAGRGESDGSGE